MLQLSHLQEQTESYLNQNQFDMRYLNFLYLTDLKRNVDIHDVGNSALYLLSDLANGVTGEIHYVDAGYNKVGMPDPKNIT